MPKYILLESVFKDLFDHSFPFLHGKLDNGTDVNISIKAWFVDNNKIMFVCDDETIDYKTRVYGTCLVVPYDRDARFQMDGIAEFVSKEAVTKYMITNFNMLSKIKSPRIFTMSSSSSIHYLTPLDPHDPQSPFIDTIDKLFLAVE